MKGASRLAASLGVPPLVIGLTVVAFGTSAPELMVSLDAALRGSSDIAIGNVVGSNIANIGLILGLSGLLGRIPIHISLIRREIPIVIIASVVGFLMAQDGQIGTLDGAVLFTGIVIFTAVLIMLSRWERLSASEERELEAEEGIDQPINRLAELGRLGLGILLLVAGANLLVQGAVAIARALGISELVIGMTLVSVGTSLPELATALIAALRRQNDILFGNVIGSNIFNLLSILGITALVRPIPIEPRLVPVDMPVMIDFALLLVLFSLRRLLLKRQSAIILAAYRVYLAFTFLGT